MTVDFPDYDAAIRCTSCITNEKWARKFDGKRVDIPNEAINIPELIHSKRLIDFLNLDIIIRIIFYNFYNKRNRNYAIGVYHLLR